MENLDDNLDSPLLGDNNDNSNNNNGITLNGDSIDLRDLLLGGRVGGVGLDSHDEASGNSAAAFGRVHHENNDSNNSSINQGGNSVEEERTAALLGEGYTTEGEGPTSSGTLSLDDNRSSFTARSNKKSSKSIRLGGQIMYYKARRQLSNIISYLTTKATASSDGENNYISNNMSNNQVHNGRNHKIITQKSSLSSSKTTPSILKLLIPPFLIINHILFFQGQTQPMWNLAYKTNITITATATTLKSKAAYDTLNLPHDYTFEHQENQIVETFTYMDAIRKLWKGDGLGNAQTLSKVAAALLILFSGIWPHLKLVLVHVCWFVPFVHRLFLTRGGDDGDEQQRNEYYSERHLCCKSKKESTGNNNLCCSNGHFHNTSNRRSPFLRTLSTLGKWSLADILVVCILIAVLHLDWKVNPYEIRSGVENELPKIIEYVKVKYPDVNGNCEQLLGYYCEVGKALVIHYPQCLACKTLISNAYTHPEWATSEGKDIMEGIDLGGGGYAQLRVMGMVGTYYFCASVIMSILLSLVVDMYDERDRQRVEEDLMDRKSELEFILPGEEGYGGGGGNEEQHYDLQLSEEEGPSSLPPHQPPPSNLFHQGHHRFTSSTTSSSGPPRRPAYRVTNSFHYATDNTGLRPPIPKPTTNSRLLKHVIMSLLSIISLPFVCYAVTLPTMERLVFGGGPALIHEVVGMVWEQEYSLITLVKTTGDAGGWDTFLMLTFGMFVVVGPILRAVCLTLNACLGIPVALLQDCIERPRHRTTVRLALYQATTQLQKALRPAIDCLGAFCSWEVLIVALIMIQLEMPSITDTIYQDDKCQEADPEHGRTCIEVQFNALDTFLVVVVSFFILTGASAFAMTLASSEDEQPLLNDEGEKRYEYGQPIPQRQAAFMRNDHVNSGYNNDDEPLEQIVFI